MLCVESLPSDEYSAGSVSFSDDRVSTYSARPLQAGPAAAMVFPLLSLLAPIQRGDSAAPLLFYDVGGQQVSACASRGVAERGAWGVAGRSATAIEFRWASSSATRPGSHRVGLVLRSLPGPLHEALLPCCPVAGREGVCLYAPGRRFRAANIFSLREFLCCSRRSGSSIGVLRARPPHTPPPHAPPPHTSHPTPRRPTPHRPTTPHPATPHPTTPRPNLSLSPTHPLRVPCSLTFLSHNLLSISAHAVFAVKCFPRQSTYLFFERIENLGYCDDIWCPGLPAPVL